MHRGVLYAPGTLARRCACWRHSDMDNNAGSVRAAQPDASSGDAGAQTAYGREAAAGQNKGAPHLPPPPPPPAAIATANGRRSSWRNYLDCIVGLCRDAAEPPAAHLLQPPPELLAAAHRTSPRRSHGRDGDHLPALNSNTGDNGLCSSAVSGATTGRPVAPPSSSEDPVLVLVDMNGTLLYRAKKPLMLPSVGNGQAGSVAFVHGDPVPLQYYMRPGAADFVAAMVQHPRARLAFYTSMRGVNAIPAARFLLPGDDDGDGVQPEVYDRPFNAHDPQGANHWDTTRDLPLIWSTPGRAGAGFGPSNTVMVDDTPRKMRFMDAGLVVVPEYTEACVVETYQAGVGTEGGGDCEQGGVMEREEAARRQADVMPGLTEYMGRLLEDSGADVRPFIKRNPFLPTCFGEASEETPATASMPAPLSSNEVTDAAPSAAGRTPLECTPSASLPRTIEVADADRGRQPGLSSSPVGVEFTPPQTALAAGTMSLHDRQGLSISEAIELVLTSGPLARRMASQEAGAAAPEAACNLAAATLVVEPAVMQGFSEEFGESLEASVVAAITDLLREASAAAERWGLSPAERERLAAWSRAAEDASVPKPN